MPRSDTKKRDAVRTKAAILNAAIAEFAARGPAGTRVDEVAARAGVNKSLIYQYFGSKQELYAEALNSVLQAVTERSTRHSMEFAQGTVAQGDAKKMLRSLLEAQLTLLEAVPEYPRLLAWENLEGGETLGRLPLQHTYDTFLQRLQLMAEPLMARGLLAPNLDLRLAAQTIIALLHYFLIYRGVQRFLFHVDPSQPASRAQWLDHCTEMLASAMVSPRAQTGRPGP